MTSSDTLVHHILSRRIPLLLLFCLLVAAALPGLLRLNITVNLEDYFLEDDPVLASQGEFDSIFPVGDFVGVLVEASDVFSHESLSLIAAVGDALSGSVPGAGELASLTTIGGALTSGALLDFDGNELVSTVEEIEAFRDAASASALLNGTFFSSDFREAWVILPILENPKDDDLAVGKATWKALEGLSADSIQLTASGVPIVAYRKQVELTGDLIRVLIIAGIGAVILSSLILRSFRGVTGTLSVFIGSVILILGAQGWAGATVDSGFIGVPILLAMGISIGYTVHIHRFYRLEAPDFGSRQEAVRIALSKTIRPIFFTALTTIAALVSFLFVDVRPIRWVGYTSSLIIVIAFLASITVFPAILSFGPEGRQEKGRDPRFLEALFRRTAGLCDKRGGMVLAVFLIAAVLSVVGSLRLVVDFDAVEMMGTRLPHMKDQVHVGASQIAVGEYMNLMVTLPEEAFNDVANIRRIADLEQRMGEIAGIRRVASVTTVLSEMNSLLHRRDANYSGLPEKDVEIGTLVRLTDNILPEERRNWIDDSGSHARFFIEVSDFSSRNVEAIIDETLASAAAVFPEEAGFSVSGSTYQVAMMNQYITRGLLRSVTTALITISIIMVLVFRSFSWGMLAMIPNIFPVLVAGAVLGFAGIPLEFVTMTVAPIVLGLAVDDTIHFMSFLREDVPLTGNFRLSLDRTLRSVGAAITETTIILCVTFLIFSTSRVNSIRYMGIVAASGMFAAYLADLLVVPVLARLMVSGADKKKNSIEIADSNT